MNFFSKNLTYLLRKYGVNHDELANVLGVRPNTISNYKNSVSEPDYGRLEKIISFFKVTADEILYQDIESLNLDDKSKNMISEDAVILELVNIIEKLISEKERLKMENEDLYRELKNKSNPRPYVPMASEP